MKTTTSSRLKEIMSERNLRQVDILEMIAPYSKKMDIRLAKNDLSQYVSGKVEPSQEKLTLLSLALNVSEPWLMGYDVAKRETTSNSNSGISVPLVGTIAAGTPILAEENIERYFNIDSSIKADFCLRIKGDSMINEGIHNNDIVFIHQQPILENGEIGAVIIDGEATLKRLYKTDTGIVLQPANEKYAPIIVDENSNLIIAGKLSAILNIKN